jgi:5-methylcytosine-specific restriction endonuclease McrBC regulatory subunit McrC
MTGTPDDHRQYHIAGRLYFRHYIACILVKKELLGIFRIFFFYHILLMRILRASGY